MFAVVFVTIPVPPNTRSPASLPCCNSMLVADNVPERTRPLTNTNCPAPELYPPRSSVPPAIVMLVVAVKTSLAPSSSTPCSTVVPPVKLFTPLSNAVPAPVLLKAPKPLSTPLTVPPVRLNPAALESVPLETSPALIVTSAVLVASAPRFNSPPFTVSDPADARAFPIVKFTVPSVLFTTEPPESNAFTSPASSLNPAALNSVPLFTAPPLSVTRPAAWLTAPKSSTPPLSVNPPAADNTFIPDNASVPSLTVVPPE